MYMMGDSTFNCPLCCDESFDSIAALTNHLSNLSSNLVCPICNIQVTLSSLENHINQDHCQSQKPQETVYIDNINSVKTEQNTDQCIINITESSNNSEETNEVNKMYVDILNKQYMKPLQSQELKLIKADGDNHFIILTNPEHDDKHKNEFLVTKQNHDGTVSLTTVNELNLETDPLRSMATPEMVTEPEPDDSQEEQLYSCNTCGVSFNSVVDHIQNYHNDQEVVVEEPVESSDDVNDFLEFEVPTGELLGDKLTPSKRVITDAGQIIEAKAIDIKDFDNISAKVIIQNDIQDKKEEVVEKRVRGCSKKYVQIAKFCDSVVKDINKDESNCQGPFHKVVVKEMITDSDDKIKVYNCMSCNIYVANLDEFKQHPCKTLKYPCPHCFVAYENAKSLSAHMKIHKTNNETGEGPCKCNICNTVFRSHKSLKLHKRMHDPVKSRPIEPPVETLDGLEVSHDKFLCSVCDKLIPMDYMAVHKNSHKDTNQFTCTICNKKFDSNEYLEMHMNVHSTEKATVKKPDKLYPYTCLYCPKQFARPHEKVKHERIHTGEKPHSCEICGKSFRLSYCLTLHMRTHTGARPYACPHCGKRFKANSVYNHHLLTHSEVRGYKCPYCPKAFKTAVQLAGHKNSHTKPFSCQHCNRPFASLYAVRVHSETHLRQNNLKYSCSLCGATYARSFALKDHVKQVHDQSLDVFHVKTTKEDEWDLNNAEGDPSTIQTLAKDLPNEINDIEMNGNDSESVMIAS